MRNTFKENVADEKGTLDPVRFMAKRNYKLLTSVGRGGAMSKPASTVLDTGAGPNLIHKRKADPAWHPYVPLIQRLRLLDASKRVVKFCGLI